MIDRAGLKRFTAKAMRAIQLMLFGALLLSAWLDVTSRGINHLSWSLMMASLLAGAIADFLSPERGSPVRSPSPRASGVCVIAITGAFATAAMAKGGMVGEPNPIGAAVVALGTVIACAAMWRFATRHAGEIGEARFPTT